MPPTPAIKQDGARIYLGDCLELLREMKSASIDSIVTDPPYGLSNTDPAHVVEALTKWATGERDFAPTGRGFMGKSWDAFVPPPAVWDECFRVLKPGGHLLAFAGSRTFDLMTLSIRFSGFDIRDSIAWLYGSGFPKSLDVSKAIDKAAGATREVVGSKLDLPGYHLSAHDGGEAFGHGLSSSTYETRLASSQITAPATPATPAAQQWNGWGTALKPAFEPIVVARKPPIGTVAANVLAHGTGALNIDATRVPSDGSHMVKGVVTKRTTVAGDERTGAALGMYGAGASFTPTNHEGGRWPTNVVMDGDTADALDEQSGTLKTGGGARNSAKDAGTYGAFAGDEPERTFDADKGGASRFFPTFRYQAKAPTRERPFHVAEDGTKTAHPTVKPLALMRWLVKLVTPPNGWVLDPFTGSGTTIEAAVAEGFRPIGIERDPDYLPLIQQRLDRKD